MDEREFKGADEAGDEERRAALEVLSDLLTMTPPTERLDLGDVRWRPDLVGADNRVLLLSFADEIPVVWLRRLQAAATASYKVVVAIASQSLDVATLAALQEVDARIVKLDATPDRIVGREYRSVADLIASERFRLQPSDLQRLAGERLAAALAAEQTWLKGRWYEEALTLVFSQVSWLSVEEHAYRNASEEIDLVLAVRALGYIADLAGGPIGVATAKNEAKATGSDVVKYLKEQMANRKGRCKLGFLCSAGKISADAEREILRGSQAGDQVIVPIERETLEQLIEHAHELDKRMEDLLRKAVIE